MNQQMPTTHRPWREAIEAARGFDWATFHRTGSGLVSEAAGWARCIDPSDDEALLLWARHFLPRLVGHADTSPNRRAITPTRTGTRTA